jgi:biofilm PGA synthesis N-glycosyltransferase PgaC
MIFVFWVSAIAVAYVFCGYAGLMWCLARVSAKPVAKGPIWPSVSIVMAVHNGGGQLAAKLENLSALNYPKEKMEIVVASDGSTDNTAEILRSSAGIKAVFGPRAGKAEALNRALAVSNNEIVVFTDVRQRVEPDAITELVSNFADETVGCVSGELMFGSAGKVSGVSAYWHFEKMLRKSESDSGSVMGATGALYGARRSLIPSLPIGTLLDDVYVPLHIARNGKRVIFEPEARVWDEPSRSDRSEFRRKQRTLAGNLQLLELAPWAVSDRAVWFRFVSHKLGRLVAPWLLLAMLGTSWALAGSKFYLVLAVLQSLLYVVAIASALLPSLSGSFIAAGAQAFCLMNAAAAVALFTYARHRHDPTRIWFGGVSNPTEMGRCRGQ